jgi:hypothetical protein
MTLNLRSRFSTRAGQRQDNPCRDLIRVGPVVAAASDTAQNATLVRKTKARGGRPRASRSYSVLFSQIKVNRIKCKLFYIPRAQISTQRRMRHFPRFFGRPAPNSFSSFAVCSVYRTCRLNLGPPLWPILCGGRPTARAVRRFVAHAHARRFLPKLPPMSLAIASRMALASACRPASRCLCIMASHRRRRSALPVLPTFATLAM